MKILSTKAIAMFLAIFISGTFSNAQDITGQWNGVLSVQGKNLRLVFHISHMEDGYKSTMDSPDQSTTGIPVDTTTFNGTKLLLSVSGVGMSYEGEFKPDSIVGMFKQGSLSVPMTLKRTPAEPPKLTRPQEPKPPYPYRSENVTFENKAAGVTLAGTLTLPETGSNFTAVILITGTGPVNRDEEVMGHKPFLVIADYLTRNGIAVLRYDDRGFAQSTGDFKASTIADFADDAESAVAYLKTCKEIDPEKIGLLGHSEGGIVAPIVAARSNDVSFIVSLAGVGLRGGANILLQQANMWRFSEVSEEIIDKLIIVISKSLDKIVNTDEFLSQQEIIDFMTEMKDEISAGLSGTGMTADNYIQQFAPQLSTPARQYFIRFDPASALEKVRCPVFAINGAKDFQVISNENLSAIRNCLEKGGNDKVTIKEYPDMNHLFQECTTGYLNEYATIEQTISPKVLKDILNWILTHNDE